MLIQPSPVTLFNYYQSSMYIVRRYYSIPPGIFESVSHVLQSHYTPPAGKQSTRNRNSFARIFLSASSTLRAGSGKSTHVFGMISSQSVRVGNLNPPSFQQMALSLVCFYFWWIIHCLIPVPYYLSFGVTQKRLKLERLTLQKVEYKGLSVERRQKAEMT